MALCDLEEFPPPAALSATVAHGGASGDALGCYDVRAVSVVLVADAFTAAALGTGAGADLVDLADLGTGRDQPAASALVGLEDLVAVKLEEPEPAKDVAGGGLVGGVGVPWMG